MSAPAPALPTEIALRDHPPDRAEELVALFRRHPVASAGLGYHVDRGPDPFAIARLLGTGYRMISAFDGDTPVGTITLLFDTVYRDGAPVDIAYTADLKVEPGWRGRGIGDALMGEAIAAARAQLGPNAPVVTAVLADNDAGLRKNALLGRHGVTTMQPFGTARLHVLLPTTPPLARWGAAGVRVRRATRADLEAMLALWARVNGRRDLARAYTPERFAAWFDGTAGLAYWLAVDGSDNLLGFTGLWDQSAYRRFVLGDQSGLYHAARGLWTFGRLVAGMAPLPAPGEALPFRSVVNLCVPSDAPGVMAALLDRALDETRAGGGLFLGLALDETDPLTHVAERFWGTRAAIRLLGNEGFRAAGSRLTTAFQAEIALG